MCPQNEYLEYFRLFQKGEFFECHEVLEKLWLQDRSDSRNFYKGLIQLAAALHHLERGNLNGAQSLYGTARQYLQTYAPVHLGLDVAQVVRDFDIYFQKEGAAGIPLPALHLKCEEKT